MCTCITFTTENHKSILARNFDYTDMLEHKVFIIPRRYKWQSRIDGRMREVKYALLGMGSNYNNIPILADLINEHGLMGENNYFEGYAHYETKKHPQKENVEPFAVLLATLSNCRNVGEVIKYIQGINIVSIEKEQPGLHWVFSDATGESIVVEKTKEGLQIFRNDIGVMTNEPDYVWNLTNLEQYEPFLKREEGTTCTTPLTLGIPGDVSPISRFVRAAVTKSYISPGKNEITGITNAFKILDSCKTYKGVPYDTLGSLVYTIYNCAICSQSRTYYYKTYENDQINAVCLMDYDLDGKQLITLPIGKKQNIKYWRPE